MGVGKIKFGSPTITLSLLVQNGTVKVGCTVHIFIIFEFDRLWENGAFGTITKLEIYNKYSRLTK